MITNTRESGQKGVRARAAHADLLSVEDVCNQLAITRDTFYEYRKRYRKFRTVKVGNRTYMRRETLDEFLKELERQQA